MRGWGLDECPHPLAPVFMMRDDGPDTETLKTDDAGSWWCNVLQFSKKRLLSLLISRGNFVTQNKNVILSKKIFQNSLFYSGGTNRKLQRKTVQP